MRRIGIKAFLFRGQSVFANSGGDNSWDFRAGDFNGAGAPVDMVLKHGASGQTKVHVMDGSNGWGSYFCHIATMLPTPGRDNASEFELAD